MIKSDLVPDVEVNKKYGSSDIISIYPSTTFGYVWVWYRASDTKELAATVPAVAAANNESDAIALVSNMHQAVSMGLAPGMWYQSNRALVEKIAQQARIS